MAEDKILRDVYINAQAIGGAHHPLYVYDKEKRQKQAIKALKYLIIWLVALLSACYLSLVVLLSVPEVQNWIGRKASNILSQQLSSRVHIGHVEISLPNRVVVDSLFLWDRNDSLLLSVRRAGAKMEWTPLLTENRISIANAQLMGAGVHIYQGSDSLYNIHQALGRQLFKLCHQNQQTTKPHLMPFRHQQYRYLSQW